MITVEEAKKIIAEAIPRGKRIATDISAPFDFPLFTSSAMDGYALRWEETKGASKAKPVSLKIAARIFAGDNPSQTLQPGETAQIMTGAMLPEGADSVIPLEEVRTASNEAILIESPCEKGAHVRPRGEEIRKGELAATAGTRITPAVIGYLASLGIREVPAFEAPRICLIPTGSELVSAPAQISPGKIFESNTFALGAALRQGGITPTLLEPVADREETLREAIRKGLEGHDILLVSGGVSVGEKDYVRPVLESLGVEILFHGVAQKPGKPLCFGKRDDRFVFGLPGNPVSALVCFYEYARPALLQWLGQSNVWPREETARLTEGVAKKKGRSHFLRARAVRNGGILHVTPFASQESHRMGSFAQANCLALIPCERERMEKGATITIHWID